VLVFLEGVRGPEGRPGVPYCKKVPCLGLEQLVPYLREQKNVLPYEQAKELFATLDGLTK
jgi:hypothetical protein